MQSAEGQGSMWIRSDKHGWYLRIIHPTKERGIKNVCCYYIINFTSFLISLCMLIISYFSSYIAYCSINITASTTFTATINTVNKNKLHASIIRPAIHYIYIFLLLTLKHIIIMIIKNRRRGTMTRRNRILFICIASFIQEIQLN